MNYKISSVIILLALTLFSCSQVSEKKYNDTVANMYAAYSTTLSAKMNKITSESADKSTALAEVKGIEQSTDSCINVLNGLHPSDKAKNFHEKVLTVLHTMKSEFVPLANKMAAMKGSDNVEEYNKLIESFNNMATKLTKEEEEAQSAQRDYVAKVGMEIQ